MTSKPLEKCPLWAALPAGATAGLAVSPGGVRVVYLHFNSGSSHPVVLRAGSGVTSSITVP